MKFSVFVILSLLLSTTFAVPAKWKEYDELMAMSNDNELQEKRFALTSWLLAKAGKAALGAAIKAFCNATTMPDSMKGVCSCGSIIAGDEEVELQNSKRSFSDMLASFKSTVDDICDNKYAQYLIGSICQCVRTFF